MTAALDFLGRELRTLRDRGYTVEQIVGLLKEEGIEASSKALYAFFKKDAPQPKERTAQVAPSAAPVTTQPPAPALNATLAPMSETTPSPELSREPPLGSATASFSVASIADAPALEPLSGGFSPFKG